MNVEKGRGRGYLFSNRKNSHDLYHFDLSISPSYHPSSLQNISQRALDRDTAKIVAFNVQKLARKLGKAVVAATTHTDLFEDLRPSVHIHKRFGKEIQVKYLPDNSFDQ